VAIAVVAMVAVVFVVPVAFVHLPAAVVVVVVGVAPVGPGVGRTLPDAGTPNIATAVVSPVTFGPDVAFAGHGGADFIAEGWRGAADVDVDLGEGWNGEGGEREAAGDEFEFPGWVYMQGESPFLEFNRLDADGEWVAFSVDRSSSSFL